MKFRIVVVCLLLTIAVSSRVYGLVTNITAQIACGGWINGSGDVEWTRDNTGIGVENLYYLALDGAGTPILNVSDNRSVGSSSILTLSFPWDSSPAYNPITLYLISPAGNGFEEQVHLVGTGDCDGLPDYMASPAIGYANLGEILISANAPVRPYGMPGREALSFLLPNDADGNGFDTHIITAIAIRDDVTWYAIWLGSIDFVWVRADDVQVLRLN